MKLFRIFMFALPAMVLALAGCSNDETTPNVTGEGVVFVFEHVETVSRLLTDDVTLDDLNTVKITLLDAAGKELVLPSLTVTGDSKTKQTEPYALAAGAYTIQRYTMYDTKATEMATLEPSRLNRFTVQAGQVTDFTLPFETKTFYDPNFIVNGLKAICTEVFGDDTSLWPKQWDFDQEITDWYDIEHWPYLIFTKNANIIEWFSGFDFNGPEWAVMEKLPSSITYFWSIDNIIVRDIPDFKYLSDNLYELTWLNFVCIRNTAFSEFPETMLDPAYNGPITEFSSSWTMEFYIRDCPNFKHIPEELLAFKNVGGLRFMNNGFTSIDIPLHRFENLDYIDLSGNKQLTHIAEGVFGEKSKVSVIRLDSMAAGFRLPSDLKLMPNLASVSMQACGLTSVPEQLRDCDKLTILHLQNNALTSLGNDFAGMPWLADIDLSDNPTLTAENIRIVSDTLTTLTLNNCGLTALPSLAGMPKLRGLFLENNDITALNTVDFTAVPYMRMLSLSGNRSLTSLPADFTFATTGAGQFPEYFRYLFLKGCNSLVWNAPAYWNPLNTDEDRLSLVIPPSKPYDDYTAWVESHVHIDRRTVQ